MRILLVARAHRLHFDDLHDLADSGFKRREKGREKFIAFEWFIEERNGPCTERGNAIKRGFVACEDNHTRGGRNMAQS